MFEVILILQFTYMNVHTPGGVIAHAYRLISYDAPVGGGGTFHSSSEPVDGSSNHFAFPVSGSKWMPNQFEQSAET